MIASGSTFGGKSGGVVVALDWVGFGSAISSASLEVISWGGSVVIVPGNIEVGGVSTTGVKLNFIGASWEASAIPGAGASGA